jgi:hypothetical protein
MLTTGAANNLFVDFKNSAIGNFKSINLISAGKNL